MFRAAATLLLALHGVQAVPHIVVVVGDNIGWANVGWHEGYTKTTSMDTILQQEGIELQRHYVHMSSSPTRASLLSGRLPLHVSENQSHSCNEQGSIPLGMTTVAQKLKKAGYATYQIGKWDIGGFGDQLGLPISKGFDESFGFLGSSEDHYTRQSFGCGCSNNATDLWRSSNPATSSKNDTTYSSTFYSSEVTAVLDRHVATTPLFLLVGAQGAGAPLQPDVFAKAYENETDDFANYNGMVSSVDSLVSTIVGKLKDKNMWEQTVFVFTSDSGGDSINNYANNYPLKGGSGSSWEGGVRVPTFISGGMIPQEKRGTALDGLMHITDWYATFCKLAGVDPADADAVAAGLPAVDSIDLWQYITGAVAPVRTELVISTIRSAFSFGDKTYSGSAAFIQGDFKIVRGPQANCLWFSELYPNASSTPPTEGACDCAEGCLYNITADPSEMMNVKDAHPEVFNAILQTALQYDNESIEHGRNPDWRKELNVTRSCDQPNHNGGFWGPYINDPVPTPTPLTPQGGDDGGMSTGAKFGILMVTYILTICLGIGGVKGYRLYTTGDTAGKKKFFGLL